MKTKVIFSLLCMALFSNNAHADDINIIMLKNIENPNVVPITLEFRNAVLSGERIEFFGDNKLALRVLPKSGIEINAVATRIKMLNGTDDAFIQVHRLNGDVEKTFIPSKEIVGGETSPHCPGKLKHAPDIQKKASG